MLRGFFLAAHFHPSVAIVRLHDGKGHEVAVFAHFRVAELAPNQAFDGVDGVFGVGDGLALGRCADEHFAVVLKRDDGRRGARALGVFDDFGGVAFKNGDAGIGGSQVNADDFAHDVWLQ